MRSGGNAAERYGLGASWEEQASRGLRWPPAKPSVARTTQRFASSERTEFGLEVFRASESVALSQSVVDRFIVDFGPNA